MYTVELQLNKPTVHAGGKVHLTIENQGIVTHYSLIQRRGVMAL